MCATKTRTAKASLTVTMPPRFRLPASPFQRTPGVQTYLSNKANEWKNKLSGVTNSTRNNYEISPVNNHSNAQGQQLQYVGNGETSHPQLVILNKNQAQIGINRMRKSEDEWEEVEDEDIEEEFEEKEPSECSVVLKLSQPISNNWSKVQNGSLVNGVDETCASSAQCSTANASNNIMDDYERVCTIGTGTFGRVILVRSKDTRKYFALKIMSICDVIHMKQIEHVHSEKKVLEKLNHPFIINLYRAEHDNRCLYMLFDFAPGGELFSYLRTSGNFPNDTCRFYSAEIVCALDYLHKKNIVYRDLKPENLLLDRQGHLKLTDFGFAKELHDRQVRTWTLCGTPEYLAPEVIEGKGHNKAVDWWALGILIYEMQVGYPAFYGDNALKIYEKILEGRLKFSKKFDLVAKDLVKKLLVSDRIRRLGNLKCGSDDIKNHKWFKSISWSDVVERKLMPPITPKLYGEGDTGNFDEYEEEEIADIPIAADASLILFDSW